MALKVDELEREKVPLIQLERKLYPRCLEKKALESEGWRRRHMRLIRSHRVGVVAAANKTLSFALRLIGGIEGLLPLEKKGALVVSVDQTGLSDENQP